MNNTAGKKLYARYLLFDYSIFLMSFEPECILRIVSEIEFQMLNMLERK